MSRGPFKVVVGSTSMMKERDRLVKESRRAARANKIADAVRMSVEELERRQMLALTAVLPPSYSVPEGQALFLDGTASTDDAGTIVAYHWDLNYDGKAFHEDATGNPEFDAIDGP